MLSRRCVRCYVEGPVRACVYCTVTTQAATWDLNLTAAVLGAVALEARIVWQRNFRLTNGLSVQVRVLNPASPFLSPTAPGFQGLNAEGGPLANTVHDPRWGRIQVRPGVADAAPILRATDVLPLFAPRPRPLFAGDLRRVAVARRPHGRRCDNRAARPHR